MTMTHDISTPDSDAFDGAPQEDFSWGSFAEPASQDPEALISDFADLLNGSPTARVSTAVLRARLAIADLDSPPDQGPAEKLAQHLYNADDWDTETHWDDADPDIRGRYLDLAASVEEAGWAPITSEADRG